MKTCPTCGNEVTKPTTLKEERVANAVADLGKGRDVHLGNFWLWERSDAVENPFRIGFGPSKFESFATKGELESRLLELLS